MFQSVSIGTITHGSGARHGARGPVRARCRPIPKSMSALDDRQAATSARTALPVPPPASSWSTPRTASTSLRGTERARCSPGQRRTSGPSSAPGRPDAGWPMPAHPFDVVGWAAERVPVPYALDMADFGAGARSRRPRAPAGVHIQTLEGALPILSFARSARARSISDQAVPIPCDHLAGHELQRIMYYVRGKASPRAKAPGWVRLGHLARPGSPTPAARVEAAVAGLTSSHHRRPP